MKSQITSILSMSTCKSFLLQSVTKSSFNPIKQKTISVNYYKNIRDKQKRISNFNYLSDKADG